MYLASLLPGTSLPLAAHTFRCTIHVRVVETPEYTYARTWALLKELCHTAPADVHVPDHTPAPYVSVPEKPELQTQLGAPPAFAGHATKLQTPEKNGEVDVGVMVPL